ncbi:Gldg family protein [Erythrobacter mangrovi]|uniref:ABC transporter n=1 Tax=Erythrobacter mangrovi TaxID=2739433 RepID=A0A7D3XH44_9SPHN|nr:ABC transporter [Erythrobacter mangrovi]QKG70139.1 ABC transporter [Erythrobacter mangrovi]
MRQRLRSKILLVAMLALAGCQPGEANGDDAPLPALGLFGTISIYWGEESDVADFLDDTGEPDWVRASLEESFELVPLDALEDDMLAAMRFLILAQPRPLAPSENVALDRWVRAGGQALIFADPMLTRHSSFPIGDRRRPQDVVLLSPILARWGLELRFDDEQPDTEHWVTHARGSIPTRLAGEFALLPGEGAAACRLSAAGLVARCDIGEGHVTLVADAAVLDGDEAGFVSSDRRDSFVGLVDESFTR